MSNDGSSALADLERAVLFTSANSIVSWPTLRSRTASFASYSAIVLAAASSRSSSPLSYGVQPQLNEIRGKHPHGEDQRVSQATLEGTLLSASEAMSTPPQPPLLPLATTYL